MAEATDGLANVKLHLIDNVDKAQEFLRWLGESRPNGAISVDIETGELPGNNPKDALSPWHGRIRLAQVGDGMQGWAIPWEEWSGVFYQGMTDYVGPVICHNIAFESKWFATNSRWKFPWHQAHDTMLMSQIIAPNERAGLKELTSRYIDPRAASLQKVLDEAFTKNGWTWGTVPTNFDPYWSYGALDTVLTTRLWKILWADCQPGARYSEPYELEMAARRICTRMEVNGARVDLEYSQRKYDALTEYVERVKQWGRDTYGGASLSSPVQLIRLFESLGEKITVINPSSGNKSIDKDQLKMFVRDGGHDAQQLAQTVLEMRKQEKLASSYFLNFLTRNVDGVVHPNINMLAARTGRMSITEPALQTLPSEDPTVRAAFIPREEGWGIISSDLDQVEFRLTANFSEDQELIKLFWDADKTGGDVFTSIMRQIYSDDTLTKTDKRRKLVKSTVYGKLYGAGVDKMALTAGVQPHQMREVVDAFDASYPGVKRFQRETENLGMQRLRDEGVGYVITKTGRRLPADGNRIYSLTNYMIQATAAEVFKKNLIKMDQQDLTEFLIVPVHDEIVLNAPLADAKEIMETVQECMTTTLGWDVPLTSGVDGPFANWGEKYL